MIQFIDNQTRRQIMDASMDGTKNIPAGGMRSQSNRMVRFLLEQNSCLSRQVLQKKAELEITQNVIVKRLGLLSMSRDEETGAHLKRMSHFCYNLGRSIGLDKQEANLLKKAAALHDIGKIGIPDSILQKPGPLTPEENRIMMTHTEIGAGLLSGSDLPLIQNARIIARTHHEKWDGTGYNNGLKGEQIPLYGRIAGICDVLDALVSKRSYKDAWTLDHALQEIMRNSGTHFDPYLVEHLIRIRPEIESVLKTAGGSEAGHHSNHPAPEFPSHQYTQARALSYVPCHV